MMAKVTTGWPALLGTAVGTGVIMLQYKASTDSLCEMYNDRIQDLVKVPK